MSCSYEFSSGFIPAIVAIDAIFFLVYTGIGATWFILRITNMKKKHIAKWYFYGISIICLTVATLLELIFITLSACDRLTPTTYVEANLSTTWLYWISSVLLLANLLLPIAGHMYKIAKLSSAKAVYATGGAIVGFISILTIAYLGVATSNAVNVSTLASSTVTARGKLSLVLNVFYFLASLFALAEITGLFASMRSKVHMGRLNIWIPILIVCFFGLALEGIILAGMIYSGAISSSLGGTITELIFLGIFQTGTYLAILMAGENQVFVAGAVDPNSVQVNNRQGGPETDHYPHVSVPGQHHPPGMVPVYAYQPQIGHQGPPPNMLPVPQQPGQPMLYQVPGQPGAYYQMPMQQQQHMYPQPVSSGGSQGAPSVAQRTISPVHEQKPVEIEAPGHISPAELQGNNR